MKEAFYMYFGGLLYWLTPSNWYWSKTQRRARQFSRDYVAEYKECEATGYPDVRTWKR